MLTFLENQPLENLKLVRTPPAANLPREVRAAGGALLFFFFF
jgi:hypothetical protein